VVRDAVRILMAWGLVTVHHGKGAFVTVDQGQAFDESLLLALRRDGATVWDVEEFEMMMYPEIAVLIARHASDAEIADLLRLVPGYVDEVAKSGGADIGAAHEFLAKLYRASGNALLARLGRSLVVLRNVREFLDEENLNAREVAEFEGVYYTTMLEAIRTRDEEHIRATVRRLMALPSVAIAAMRSTPVGGIPSIPMKLSDYLRHIKATE
jgi:DNA-binding FadR family transcriptional regulator